MKDIVIVFLWIVEHLSEQVMYILFWGSASAITLGSIYYFGREFVDRPKLVQAKLKTEWTEMDRKYDDYIIV